jgi:hypothetical protein
MSVYSGLNSTVGSCKHCDGNLGFKSAENLFIDRKKMLPLYKI